MQKHKIRLNRTNSVTSVNKDNRVAVELQQTTKPLIFTSLKEEVDQYEVFKRERDNCTQYRFIATINPFCTNILFNPMTEVVYNEGDETECKIVRGEVGVKFEKDKIYGITEPTLQHMIRNTEYSREDINYEYHPGIDIFNNHILRNKTFKVVNPNKGTDNKAKFNTIEDLLRDYKGDTVDFTNRTSLNVINTTSKHLYDHSDIMSVTDSINNNLREDNGWFGFVNKSTIIAKRKEELVNNRIKWVDEDFNHVINNKESCEFIDMYPDRTLFSFNPKYNKFKHRPEYNWNVCLTYPYENFYNHRLIKDDDKYEYITIDNEEYRVSYEYITIDNIKKCIRYIEFNNVPCYQKYDEKKQEYENVIEVMGNSYEIKTKESGYLNAVLLSKVIYTTGINGENILLFQTFNKHNLKPGDYINIYCKKGDENFYSKTNTISVTNIGDLDKNNNDYFFYTTNLSLLFDIGYKEEVYEMSVNKKQELTNEIDKYQFRFTHLINGYESEYYIRLFSKLPNIKKKSEKLTDEIANNYVKLSKYVGTPLDFDKEQYQLAFASTIYNDNKTQITFTDGIDVEKLLDNRGRPVSEIYLTIIKNNKGNKHWYSSNFTENKEDYEFSHCFSEVSCGFNLYFDEYEKNAKCSDVKTITTHNKISETHFGWDYLPKDTIPDPLDLTVNDNIFIGDLVEFNITNCNEAVLEDCNFRFNTYMREHASELSNFYKYSYDEIVSDDYDLNGFQVTTYTESKSENLNHLEGYFYKAHYKIPLKEFDELHQNAHYDIRVKSLKLDSIENKVMLFIETALPHKLSVNGTVLVCDDDRDRILKAKVVHIESPYSFAIMGIGSLTCHNLYDILSNKYDNIRFKLRRYNVDIPFYAEKYPNLNRYMWRDINTTGNINNTTVPEYPFANGYLYIYQDINFYLKRQDPFNTIGLYYDANDSLLPNDVFGNIVTPSEYEYKDESEVTC